MLPSGTLTHLLPSIRNSKSAIQNPKSPVLPALLTDTVTPDLDRALHYTLLWGLEGVELRTVGGAGDRVPFVNEAKLKRRLAERELPAVAIVPGLFEGRASDRAGWLNEVAAFEETLQFCRRIGCPRVVVSAFEAEEQDATEAAAEALRQAGRAATRHGIDLAVLNEAGRAHATAAALAALLAHVDQPNVQAAWQPAEALQAGEDPAAGLENLAGRIALARGADGVILKNGWEATPLGTGRVGWPEQLRLLRKQGFDGPLSLEIHVAPRPKQGLRDATTLIRLLRESRG